MTTSSKLGLVLLAACIFVASIPAAEAGPRDVILLNMTIFETHQLLGDPTIYFKCSDNRTKVYLPDVTDENQLYGFNGHESFQPLTTLPTDQCKRCGVYNERWLIEDATFVEWELCPLEFAANGTYEKKVRHELDAIFYCQECSGAQAPAPAPKPPVVVLTPTAVPSSVAGAPSTAVGASLVNRNSSALPSANNRRPLDGSGDSGLSPAMLAIILVIIGLCVAGLLLVGVVFYYRRKVRRVRDHEKAVQELAYVEDDLKAGPVEKV